MRDKCKYKIFHMFSCYRNTNYAEFNGKHFYAQLFSSYSLFFLSQMINFIKDVFFQQSLLNINPLPPSVLI